jgi:hypothetical protein
MPGRSYSPAPPTVLAFELDNSGNWSDAFAAAKLAEAPRSRYAPSAAALYDKLTWSLQRAASLQLATLGRVESGVRSPPDRPASSNRLIVAATQMQIRALSESPVRMLLVITPTLRSESGQPATEKFAASKHRRPFLPSLVGQITEANCAIWPFTSSVRRSMTAPFVCATKRSSPVFSMRIALSRSPRKKILLSFFPKLRLAWLIPPHAEGRTRRHDTLVRAVMDVWATADDFRPRGRRSRVVLAPRCRCPPRNAFTHCRGRDDASSVARAVTTKPGLTGESTKETVKTIAQGRPGVPARTCGSAACFLLHADHGCERHPAFPAPSVWKRGIDGKTRTQCAARMRRRGRNS